MMKRTCEETLQSPDYKAVLVDLLFQLADDDFIIAYRGSEWLGLAPHIEEDVAYSSISQDMMGHAAIFYQLLEDLGCGNVDVLAHARPSHERKNSVLLELVNGPGHYLKDPEYDWAFAVVRNYFYVQAKKIRIEALKNSSYKPLADAAVKINIELYYHLLHWKTWFGQLICSNKEARTRMEKAISICLDELEGLFSLGENEREMVKQKLIEPEIALKNRWVAIMKPIFDKANIVFPQNNSAKKGNGRNGYHTKDLDDALATLSEVYSSDPAASW